MILKAATVNNPFVLLAHSEQNSEMYTDKVIVTQVATNIIVMRQKDLVDFATFLLFCIMLYAFLQNL